MLTRKAASELLEDLKHEGYKLPKKDLGEPGRSYPEWARNSAVQQAINWVDARGNDVIAFSDFTMLMRFDGDDVARARAKMTLENRGVLPLHDGSSTRRSALAGHLINNWLNDAVHQYGNSDIENEYARLAMYAADQDLKAQRRYDLLLTVLKVVALLAIIAFAASRAVPYVLQFFGHN